MANERVVSKKTFGNHGLVIPGREPSLKTNGGLMYYHYDGMRNVTELTDRNGDSIEQYRYDAFGGLYTGITAPYNTNTFAGKSYDPKANLIDNNARWYQAQTGRFTTADPYRGEALTPYTQNRYAYAGNNPINRWDPLGYWMAGDENLSDDAFERIGELTEQWENATSEEDRDRIHEEADSVREQDRNGGYGGSYDSGSSGGSSGGSGGSSDDDDGDESYERPMRAIDWYNQNKAILAQYNAPQEQSATPIDANMARKLIIINKYLEEKVANNFNRRVIQEEAINSMDGSGLQEGNIEISEVDGDIESKEISISQNYNSVQYKDGSEGNDCKMADENSQIVNIKSTTTTLTGTEAWAQIGKMAFDVGLNVTEVVLIATAVSGTTAVTGPGGALVAVAAAEEVVRSTAKAGYESILVISAIIYTINDGGFDYTVTTLADSNGNSNEVVDKLINIQTVTPIKE